MFQWIISHNEVFTYIYSLLSGLILAVAFYVLTDINKRDKVIASGCILLICLALTKPALTIESHIHSQKQALKHPKIDLNDPPEISAIRYQQSYWNSYSSE